MDAVTNLLSWKQLGTAVAVYFASLAFYRLFLHPLAGFPGPKLAAVSRWYEAYYDVVRNGQYTFRIGEMHKQYGPIIRISPYELHVNDPAFLETLYRQDGVWHKYAWVVDAFAASGATIFTADHNVHKARRQPLGPFFSKARIASHQDVIRSHLDKLCDRFSKFYQSNTEFNFGAAITALARDVANEFILGKSYNSLEHEDFDIDMLIASQGGASMWRLTKHVRFVAPIMRAVPMDWIIKTADKRTKIFFRHLQETMDDTNKLMAVVASSTPDDKTPRTIVHGIMAAKLPPADKAPTRVFEDVSTVTGAGFETTASVLRMVFFHVFSSAEILRRLREELTSISEDPATADLKTLEQLPYLTSVLKEGLRLSPAVASRMTRIAPDRNLLYKEYKIPAGTPVGMTTILIHTDEAIYPEPKRFNPERWMGRDGQKADEKAFMPFSKGTRNCVGMYLAWAELYITVASVVHQFDFKFEGTRAEDLEAVSDQFAIGTKNGGMFEATVTPRK